LKWEWFRTQGVSKSGTINVMKQTLASLLLADQENADQ
jgi:hypothetical protein